MNKQPDIAASIMAVENADTCLHLNRGDDKMMDTEISRLLTKRLPLPNGTRIKATKGGVPTGGTHELSKNLLESANRVPNTMSDTEPFWIHGWKDLHDSLIFPVCSVCGIPSEQLACPQCAQRYVDALNAPLILELDRLQEEQLKADTLAHFSSQSSGRFSSLNDQNHRADSARRQERSIELQKQLADANYEYHPLNFPLEFYITGFYSEKELARYGNPGQKYRVEPGLPELVSDQKGCKHIVSAPTLEEGSKRVLEEHLANCIKGEK